MRNPNRTIVVNAEVAIRKKTVKIEAIRDTNKEFFLKFYYDCIREVEISIFMFVEESADQLLITRDLTSANKKKALAPFIQIFPGGKNMLFHNCYKINFEIFPEAMYMEQKGKYYPLVIKLKLKKKNENNEESTTILYNYLTFTVHENELTPKFVRQKMEANILFSKKKLLPS